VAGTLKVAVHDYRSRSGQVFYAAAREPSIPAPISAEVSELGRILAYQLIHRAKPPNIPLDVPKGGLTPPELLRTYDADQLAATGITGKGQTIVFFEIDGYRQSDLDYWADKSGLSRFAPVVIGGQPAKPSVMAVVKNRLALVAAAEGPKEKFTPKNSSHPSGVNLKIANALGNSVNSFTWNEEGSPR
jgi:kumamolisin